MDLSILDIFVTVCCFASLVLPIRIIIDSVKEIEDEQSGSL